MAPRSGPRVKVISPNSGTVTMSRSVSLASSSGSALYQHSSGHASPATAPLLRTSGRFHNTSAAAATAHAAPDTGRSALRPVGVNTSHTSTTSAGGKSTRYTNGCGATAGPTDAKAAAASRRAPLQNFFDQAAERRLPTPSASRSHSRSVHSEASLMSGRPGARRRTEEDDAAVRRATAALERAGGAVLRRPFGAARAALPVHPSSPSSSSSPRVGGNTSALPLPASDAAMPSQERRGLRLPPAIPHTRRRLRGEDGSDADDGDATDGSESAYRSRSGSRRGRTWADASARAQPRAAQTSFAAAVAVPSSASAVPPSPPRVCPGMFAGISAVPLDERLFACDALHGVVGRPHTASGSTAAGDGAQQHGQQRYCLRPLWSLVGTFKTSLSGLVTVDLNQECLRWSQRNPKGGQQLIKVPLSAVLDVFTTRVVLEDEQVEEKQFTVVVRTSTRPSQVVFGFATTTQANHMRSILKRR